LIELVVTVLLIGILASIAIPDYMRSVEVGKADDAVSTVNMVGTTNKMFALDHGGVYAIGLFPAPTLPTVAGAVCGTNGGVCPAAGPWGPCALVWCKYLADQDWGDKPYSYSALNGALPAGQVASAARGGTAAPGPNATYAGWGYTVATSGRITAVAGAPAPTY
jgi:type II secretory pathway pseudopilin PulG